MKLQQILHRIFIAIFFSIISIPSFASVVPLPTSYTQTWQLIKSDYRNFYLSREHWLHLGGAFALGGLIANSHTDQYLSDRYQEHLRGSKSDDLSKFVKHFGNWKTMLPVSVAAMGIDYLKSQSPQSLIGIWGEQTLRAYITAAPLMYSSQWLTGASRPGERENASHWRPLEDVNGVSGHAFVGAVPFLTIARMSSNPYLHYGAYAASTLTALSRINDNAHFPSQAFLGWYVAYETTQSVFEPTRNSGARHTLIVPLNNGAELEIDYQW